MKILSIETSCDETAVAILEASGGFQQPVFRVLGNTLLSQALKHAEFGGVYPSLAKREHTKNLIPVLKKTLEDAHLIRHTPTPLSPVVRESIAKLLEREPDLLEQVLTFVPTIAPPEVDAIAATHAWGLEPALWAGLNFGRALATLWNKPFTPINHLEGHVMSVLWSENGTTPPVIQFPALALIVSGGDTELVLIRTWMEYETLGKTRDDAVGEAFDKVARILDLPYPGGPAISELASKARDLGLPPTPKQLQLPRPMINSDDYDFSFSGLKTSVLYKVKKLEKVEEETKLFIAREFEDAVIETLVQKTKKALEAHSPSTLMVVGGVSANQHLRTTFQELLASYPETTLRLPEAALATDNAIMIGIAGYFRSLINDYADPLSPDLRAQGRKELRHNRIS